jgi:N-sulfoglucosamine sulfohydrolase
VIFPAALVAQKPAPPNILLIVSEDNGPELGCYGDPYAQTHHLDRLARQGVLFERAYVPYSVCSPSRACFLTGLYPHQNGQIGLATHKYAMYGELPNLFSILKGAGYRTGIMGKLHVNPESAFPFDFRHHRTSDTTFTGRNVFNVADKAAEFFNESDQPFVMSVNYSDAHFPLIKEQHGLPRNPLTGDDVKAMPWVGADSPRIREFAANYYNCLSRLDTGIGLLMKELDESGKADETLVIYIGDHGAQFSRGKTSVYEAGLKIPMIVRWPGHAKPGHRPTGLVSSIDILPTVLEACDIEQPTRLPGKPLQGLLAGGNDDHHEYIVAVTNGSAPVIYGQQFSIRDDRWRLVISPFERENLSANAYLIQKNAHFHAGSSPEEIAAAPDYVRESYATYLNPPRYELYDLDSDPYEWKNLAEDRRHVGQLNRLKKAFAKWQDETDDPHSDPVILKALDEEHIRMQSYDYRGDKNFRWEYLDLFDEWRKKRQ